MRTKNSLLTVLTSIGALIITGVLGFIKIRYFIGGLGSDANGLIQMIYRILSYISLAELGLGGALIYKLYKPFSTKNEEQISKLINTATYFFNKIGVGIIAFLLVFMFVIPYIIKDTTFENSYLYLLFFLAGLPYAIEYIWYKKYHILLLADQKQYIINLVFNTSTIIYDIVLVIALTKNITLVQYILISYPFIFIKGFLLQLICNKKYSYIRKTKEIDKEAIKLSKDVFIHNIGSSINNSSDQIVLSIFKGLTYVSIYSSYIYIVNYLNSITGAFLRSTTHSFGNLFSQNEKVDLRSYNVYLEYLSFASFLSVIISSTFFVSIIPFINYWIKNPIYVLNLFSIIAFTLLIYTKIIAIPINIAISSLGLFKETKYYSFIATIVNIVLSIILIQKYQIGGLIIATVISILIFQLPLVLRKMYQGSFNEFKQFDYYKEIIKSLFLMTIIIVLSKFLKITALYNNNLINWLLISFIFFVCISIIIGMIYYFTNNHFKDFIYRCLNLLKLRRHKNENITNSTKLS